MRTGCKITDSWKFYGLQTVVMENEIIKMTILVDKGADIIELVYKPLNLDLMWHSPLSLKNYLKRIPSIHRSDGYFLDFFEGGWQEILPSGGGPCVYKGAELGLQGETWGIPWDYSILQDSPDEVVLEVKVRTYRTPFLLSKTITLQSGSPKIIISEKLTNESPEDMDIMWGHHPTFGPPFFDSSCRLDIPAKWIETAKDSFSPNSRLSTSGKWEWPNGLTIGGEFVDLSKAESASAHTCDLCYLTGLKEGWYALTNQAQKVGFALSWPKEIFQTVWLWQVYGGAVGHPWYSRTYCCGIEPWTSYLASGVTEAVQNGTAYKINGGQSVSLQMTAVIYTGFSAVEHVEKDGTVRGIK